MPKRPSSYYRPDTLDDALRLLSQPDTVPLAGGSKLLASDITSAVVDLQDLGLNQLSWDDTQLNIGATVTLADLAQELANQQDEEGPSELLRYAIQLSGPNTYRNAATLGGTIASRLADSELLAVLLTLEAHVSLHSSQVMSISLMDYLNAVERPVGLINNVTIPWTAGRGISHRVARTPADYPIVSVTLWQPADESPRLAASGIAQRPFRLINAEIALAGGMTEPAIDAAASAASASNSHPGDFRGDATYRSEMAAVLTRRVCESITTSA